MFSLFSFTEIFLFSAVFIWKLLIYLIQFFFPYPLINLVINLLIYLIYLFAGLFNNLLTHHLVNFTDFIFSFLERNSSFTVWN